jgi:hypothetical protein
VPCDGTNVAGFSIAHCEIRGDNARVTQGLP